jgi:hypothetical protein
LTVLQVEDKIIYHSRDRASQQQTYGLYSEQRKGVRQVRISGRIEIKMIGVAGYIPQCPRENFEIVLQLGCGPG